MQAALQKCPMVLGTLPPLRVVPNVTVCQDRLDNRILGRSKVPFKHVRANRALGSFGIYSTWNKYLPNTCRGLFRS